VGRAAVSTVGEALAAATDALAAAGCETPRLDAELLLADAVRAERATVLAHPELSVSAAAARVAMEHVRRRVAREPVAYILGRKGFRRIELAVDRRVLIPRPETELLVEVALELEQGARVHDVGTGCGAVALALRDERPDLAVSGSDASPGAVELARLNAARLGVEMDFEVRAGLPDRDFDLVVANLPYVREDEWPALAPEIVRYEPREALVAGADGLDAIRSLVEQAPPDARLALEHDPRQAATVRSLLRDAHTRRDLAGRERVSVGWVP
jgi:release factor glutamine methyltransferase